MSKSFVKENSFEGAPGGGSGTLSYSAGYGTPGGGNTVQDPSHFASSDKTTDHFSPNTQSGSAVPTMVDRPDRVGNNQGTGDKSTISPAASAEKLQSEKPLNPEQEFDPQVDQIFKKKSTPSPDEIMSALQYELSKMVKKDKTIAKQQVLKNLKDDSHYYSRLNMLNIDDKKMKVDEKSSTFDKTKAVLDDMISSKKNKVGAVSPELDQIFKDLYKKRRGVQS